MAAKRKRWPDRRGFPALSRRDRQKLLRLAAAAMAAAWNNCLLSGSDDPDGEEEYAALERERQDAMEAEKEARAALFVALAWSDAAKRDPMEQNEDYAVVLPDGSVIGVPCGFEKYQERTVLAAPAERVIRLDLK
jgi:hypothetical protein